MEEAGGRGETENEGIREVGKGNERKKRKRATKN